MIAVNARPLVMLAAGPQFYVPSTGWTNATYRIKAPVVVRAFHRVATIVRGQQAAKIARRVSDHIKAMASEVAKAARRHPAGKAASGFSLDALWEETIKGVIEDFEGELARSLLGDVQSAVSQGYSKTNLLMGKKDKPRGNGKRQRKAKKIADKQAVMDETTAAQMRLLVKEGQDIGLDVEAIADRIEKVLTTRAPRRGRAAGRTVAQEAWSGGSVDSMEEAEATYVDVIGCISREEDLWDKPYYAQYLFDADGRSPESSCNIRGVPIQFADQLNFHPNHTGTIVPVEFKR